MGGRLRLLVSLVVVALITMPGTATGYLGPKGIDRADPKVSIRLPHVRVHEGRAVPPSTNNFEILSHLVLPGRASDADIALYDHGRRGLHAYIGSWQDDCANDGVKIVDVSRARHPRVDAVAKAPIRHSSSEDVDIVRIGDRVVMGTGLQPCGRGGFSGFAMFDVTRPRHPRFLALMHTPGIGVHELDLVVRPDGTALALLATPFADFGYLYFDEPRSGEVQIVDISRPRKPKRLARWSVFADSDLASLGRDPFVGIFQGMGSFAAVFAHSVRAADDGMTAYVSYWDAGIVKLDISDPTSPTLVGRTQYSVGDDGDAHSMTPLDAGGTRYIYQNDEDGDPDSPDAATSSVTGARKFNALDMWWMPKDLRDVGQVTGTVLDAGDGCQGQDYEGGANKVVVVDTLDWYYTDLIEGWPKAPCRLIKQVKLAARHGATALISNLISPGDPSAWPYRRPKLITNDEDMVVVQVADADGMVTAIRNDGGPATITVEATEPSFGFLRIFDESTAVDTDGDGVPEYRQVGSFSGLPHVRGEENPPRSGVWEIHNTEVFGNRAYSSWYSHGIVALDISDPAAPSLVGQFVPRADRYAYVWGVAIDPDTGLIYASDISSGLWIVRPTGPAASS